MNLRPLDQMVCAKCGEKVALIQVNGKSIQVDPVAATSETTIMFGRHLCKAEKPAPKPAATNGKGGYRRR